MRSRAIWAVTLCVLAVGVGPATAGDVVGKWFEQTGPQVITIYKAGPEYAASIGATQGTNAVGTYYVTLSNFSVMGTHVHFRIQSDQQTPTGHLMVGNEYDLNLSPEGQRLIGTQTTDGVFSAMNGTKPVSLFLRN